MNTHNIGRFKSISFLPALFLIILLGITGRISAAPINIGDVVSASIDSDDEIDTFEFTANAGDSLFFDVQSGSVITFNWQLSNAGDSAVFNNNGFTDQGPIVLSESGEYSLAVSSRGGRTGPYQFQIVSVPELSSTAINLNETISGAISVQGEQDEFTFTLTAEQTLYFDTLSGSIVASWALLNSSDIEVFNSAFNDIQTILLPADSYRLRIDGRGDDTFEYSFFIASVPAVSRTPIELNEVVTGEIAVRGEVDEFLISLETTKTLFFDRQVGGITSTSWALNDENGQTLFDDILWADKDAIVLNAGEYVLRVDGRDANTLNYQFQVVEIPEVSTTAISLNEPVQGSITIQGEQDEFTLSLSADQEVFFDRQEGGFTLLNWALRNDNGEEIFSAQNWNDVDPIVLTAGDYTLRMDGNGDARTDYQFQFYAVPETTTTEANLYLGVTGELTVPGQRQRFQLFLDKPMLLGIERLSGSIGSAYSWTVFDDNNNVIEAASSFFSSQASNLVNISTPGNYTLEFDGNGDFIGRFNLRLWEVIQPAPETISLDSVVSLRLVSQGQVREYEFEATQGEPLYFNLGYQENPKIWFNLFAPDSSRLFSNRISDSTVLSLPETGTYKLIASNSSVSAGVPSGNYSFMLSQTNDAFINQEAAELQITSASATLVATDNPANIEISYTVTNNGTVSTSSAAWKDRILFYSDNEFRLNVARVFDPSDFFIPVEIEHNGALASGESYTKTVNVNYELMGLTSESFEIVIEADVENQVYEGSNDVNRYTIIPPAIFYDVREITGSGAIATDVPDGSLLPSNVPIALSGTANLSGGAVNIYFIVDNSLSTSTPFGFDANGDGAIDERDDFNGDGNNGDVLDVELSSIITIANQVQQSADDVFVSVIPFNDNAYVLDLGPERFIQSFVRPNEKSFNDNDTNLAFALKNNVPRVFGTRFSAPISEVLELASIAPPSDQNFVFFLTDGQAFDAVSVEQLRALGELGVSLFAFQINNNTITSSLQAIIDEIDSHPNSSATGQSVVNPGDLPRLVLDSLSLANVEINGVAAEAVDAAGNFFSTITLNEGPNVFNIAAIDSDDNRIERQITLNGATTSGGDASSVVASQGQINYENVFFNRSTKRLFADARLQNNSALPITNAVTVNVQTDPIAVNLDTADGQNANGQFIVIFDDELGSGISTGQSSDVRSMIFSNQRTDRFAVQTIPLTSANTAPYFASTPIITLGEGGTYQYNPLVIDSDQDTLTYRLNLAPRGMSIDSSTGVITWVPAVDQSGTHFISINVVDGKGGSAEQSYQLSVTNNVANLPPFITSSPKASAIASQVYQYQVVAVDPEASGLTYSLDIAPAGVTINPSTGLLNAEAGVLEPGETDISLRVVDEQGGEAQQSWTLSVKGVNQTPVIVSSPVTTISAGSLYTYAPQVSDDDSSLYYELAAAPVGMSINSVTGVVSFLPSVSQIGSHDVNIAVTDPFGASAVQNFILQVLDDDEAPQVSLLITPNQINLGESSTVTVVASDNAGISNLVLTFDGIEQPLDANNSATITPISAGEFILTATATDINDLSAQDTEALRVIDVNDTDAPTVSIDTPSANSIASFLTDIVGSVEADDLFRYQLQYALASEFDATAIANEGPQWTTFAQGDEEVSSGLLGVFDPTILRNDDYVVRLIAEDINGNVAAAAIYVGVFSDAKIGVFEISYTDLSIPVSNIPIQISRIYRTTDAAIDGDLGYGWHLKLSDPDIRETVPVANMEETLGIFVNNAYTANTRVYLNAPDGKRIGFTFEPESVAGLLGESFIPKFKADPGVNYTLEVDPVTISQSSDGSFVLFLIPFNYNPQDFRLIEPNGTTWQYNQFVGLEKVSDRNGNELIYTENGIFHSSGLSVLFERDDEGRITTITDPDGAQLLYSYNAKGELIGFTDRVGNVESYDYLDTPQHFLQQITDINGKVTFIEFDEQGRLAASINSLGERITQDWEPESFTGTITDAKGNVTLLTYDFQGNIIREEDANGGIKLYSYDDNNNLQRLVDENGNATEYSYDDLGNVTSQIDALGNIVNFGFDEFGNRKSVTNARGSTITSAYDENGNLIQVNLPDGKLLAYTYDEQGRLLSMTDAEGNTTSYEYLTNFITPVKINLPDGNSRLRELDSRGAIISVTDELGNTTQLIRDQNGRIIEQLDEADNRYRYEYSGQLLISLTDPSGTFKSFAYDENAQLISTNFEDGNQITFTYDANGNTTSVTDIDGNVTTYTYDDINRKISRTDANGATETYAYDAVGNLISKVDRRGFKINYNYDALNRMVSEVWLDAVDSIVWQLNKTYDEVGNILTMDDGTSTIVNVYDHINRVISHQVIMASGPDTALTFKYDGNDKLIEVSDSSSMQRIRYNNRTLVEEMTLTAEAQTLTAELDYDPRGLRSSLVRKLNGNELGTSTYSFNSQQLAQSISQDVNGNIYSFEYFWDDNRRLATQRQNTETIEYVYDNIDQLTEATRDELPSEEYAFDANGNPSLDATVGIGNQLLSNANVEYEYDDAGNMILRRDNVSGQQTQFEYDHRNRLVAIKLFDANDQLISDLGYGYDPLDRRVNRRINNQNKFTNYVFDDAWTDMQADGNVNRRYLNGAQTDEKIARISSGQTAWYITDKQQTVYRIVESDGSTINDLKYDSFGQVVSESNPLDADRFTYTGRELERLAGVYDYRARTYDPVAKRFLSEDPIEFEANDANLYRYVFNNPLNGTDPTGKSVASEYGQILCNIVIPQVSQYKVLGSCLETMYEGIANAVELATSNDGLVGEFGKCLFLGSVTNAVGAGVDAADKPSGVVYGVGAAMLPPGGNGDGSDASAGDAAAALACGFSN